MQAIILAAGKGTRLLPKTLETPKCLVEINNIPILKYQIDALLKSGIQTIHVVVGYKKEKIINFLNRFYPDVGWVENNDYELTNNMYSLSLVKKYINDDVILSNADVVIDGNITQKIIGCEFKDFIVADSGVFYEESMKIIEKNGYVIDISKAITAENYTATSIDLYKFSKNTVNELFNIINSYINNNDLNKWTEVAIADLLKKENSNIKYLDIQGAKWVEVDNFKDLNYAEELFRQ